jgi:hypothetical protein
MKHHASTPVTVHGEAAGVYLNATDAERWCAILRIALDPYKAPEARAPAEEALKTLQRLLIAGAKGDNAVDMSEIAAVTP